MKLRAAVLLLAGACNPGQVLQQQVSHATNKDYTQVALEEKREADRRAEAEKARKQTEADRKRVEEDKRKAAQAQIEEHARAGHASVDLGDHDAALRSFKEAYRLSSNPKYLPMVAAATRRTGECSTAKALYKEYLEKAPAATDRADVEAQIAEADACEKNLGDNGEKVREHYRKGVTHYELSEYEPAANEFKEAYRLSLDAIFLFNIGQAYRMAKNCGESTKFFQRYLSNMPNAADKNRVNGYLAEMKKCK